MIPSDMLPPGQDYILKRITDLERLVRELIAGRALEAATIGAGGITVKAGGKVTLQDGGGVDIQDGGGITSRGFVQFLNAGDVQQLYFGPIAYGSTPAGIGMLFYRNNGSLVMSLEGPDPNKQYMTIRDNAGNIVFSDDAVSGQGLATPYIPLTAVPTSWHSSRQQSTSSTTFTGLWTITGRKQQPRLEAYLMVQCDAGVAGQVRLADPTTGNIVAGPVALAAGAFMYVTLTGPVAGAHQAPMKVDVEMRVTSGAGSVGCSLIYAEGMQS